MNKCRLFHDWSEWRYIKSGQVIDWEQKICKRCGGKKVRIML